MYITAAAATSSKQACLLDRHIMLCRGGGCQLAHMQDGCRSAAGVSCANAHAYIGICNTAVCANLRAYAQPHAGPTRSLALLLSQGKRGVHKLCRHRRLCPRHTSRVLTVCVCVCFWGGGGSMHTVGVSVWMMLWGVPAAHGARCSGQRRQQHAAAVCLLVHRRGTLRWEGAGSAGRLPTGGQRTLSSVQLCVESDQPRRVEAEHRSTTAL